MKIKQKIQQAIKSIKTTFYSVVGGQSKKQRQPYDILIGGGCGFRTTPLCDENAERSSKREKEKTMTYIISGISNGKPFLMSDCVGTDKSSGERKFSYTKKLDKLISTNEQVYFCLAGSDSYSYAINLFDRECYEKNKSFDFKNEEHISEVLEIFKQIKEYRENLGFTVDNYARLYFVNKIGVYYYDIEDDGVISQLQQVNGDCYMRPNIAMNRQRKLDKQFKNNQELISFCKDEIIKAQDYQIDLKDKFSYIIFDGNEILYDNSVKNNKELVLSLIGGSYDKLK